MKRMLLAYLAGVFTVLGLAGYMGGEFLTQVGLRLSAAQSHYDFIATPTTIPMDVTPIHTARGRK